MAADAGLIRIGMAVGTAGLAKGLRRGSGLISGFVGKVSSSLSVIGLVGNGISTIGTALSSLTGPVGLAADLEQTTVSFTTLLGSAAKARQTLSDLSDFAASTPFDLTTVNDAGKSLLAFGVSTQKLQPMMQRIGDVAAGLSIPFGDLSEIYGKAKVANTIYTEDLNQLMGRGVPIVTELAKVLGVQASEVKKLASEGKIGFADLDAAFENMTSSGGQFAGMMKAQSGTLSGLWSTLTSNVSTTLATVGTSIVETFRLKEIVSWANTLVQSVVPTIQAGMGKVAAAFDYIRPVLVQVSGLVVTFGRTVIEQVGLAFAWIGSAWSSVGAPGLDSMRESITTALAYIEHRWTYWRDYLELSLTRSHLALVTFGEQTKHVMANLPHYAWQATKQLTEWIINGLSTIGRAIINLGKSIYNLFSNLPGLIAGTADWSQVWVPLTDGLATVDFGPFESLPRELSATEKTLTAQAAAMAGKLDESFAELKAERLDGLKDQTDTLTESMAKLADQSGKLSDPAKAITSNAKTQYGGSVIERGTEAAYQAIIDYRFGRKPSGPEQDLKEQKRHTDLLGQIVEGVTGEPPRPTVPVRI